MEKLKKDEVWYCVKCGYTTKDEEPPMTCPICYASVDEFVIKHQDEITGY